MNKNIYCFFFCYLIIQVLSVVPEWDLSKAGHDILGLDTEKTIEINNYLKKKLLEKLSDDEIHNVIHPYSLGINTIITAESKSKAKKLAYDIRQRLEVNGNIITTGPNYNRIKKPCIIIEVKNLDVESLTYTDMDYLCDIIIEEIEKG